MSDSGEPLGLVPNQWLLDAREDTEILRDALRIIRQASDPTSAEDPSRALERIQYWALRGLGEQEATMSDDGTDAVAWSCSVCGHARLDDEVLVPYDTSDSCRLCAQSLASVTHDE